MKSLHNVAIVAKPIKSLKSLFALFQTSPILGADHLTLEGGDG